MRRRTPGPKGQIPSGQAYMGWIRRKKLEEDPSKFVPYEPMKVNTEPARNEPCPCGSGKKYKHCCLISPLPKPRT